MFIIRRHNLIMWKSLIYDFLHLGVGVFAVPRAFTSPTHAAIVGVDMNVGVAWFTHHTMVGAWVLCFIFALIVVSCLCSPMFVAQVSLWENKPGI